MTSSFTVATESPKDARQVVRSALAGTTVEVVEIAELLVSELVTNALIHGSGDATLVVNVDAGYLHVEVLDAESTLILEPLRVEPTSTHGRGLAIVDALATVWGVEPRLAGKAVWFDLVLSWSDA